MPHIILRHSDNLPNCDFVPFFKTLHQVLVDNLAVKLSSCSSMVISHADYLIGAGEINNAFVHLEVKVKPYIQPQLLDLTAGIVLEMLQRYLASYSDLKIKISVDFLSVTQYFKS